MADFTLHLAKKTEIDLISRMEDLAILLPWRPKLSQVYLVKDPRTDFHYLAATDGTVMRYQRIQLHNTVEKLQAWSDDRGPMDFNSILGGCLECAGSEILPDLTEKPLRLGRRGVNKSERDTWEVEAWVSDLSEVSALRVVPLLHAHLRPFPSTFKPWLHMVTAETMARFAATFIGGMEPPIFWVSEPQLDLRDPKLGYTWAKYWAYHTKSREPLGLIMGVTAPDILKDLLARK